MTQYLADIQHVKKQYNNSAKAAVQDVSLQIEAGSIFGLLGPNGAGKTTLISMLCGLFKPSAGQVLINGFVSNSNEAKREIGVVPQEIALYGKLTAWENLMFLGQMYGIETSELKKSIQENLRILGLEENRHQQVQTFSGGMKRRVNLIAGILHLPKLLILDEPTVGVDIQSKTAIIEHLKKLNKENGMTIFYTSHHLHEAEDFCTDIAIIDDGKIVTQGKTQELIQNNNCKSIEDVYLKITGNRFRD